MRIKGWALAIVTLLGLVGFLMGARMGNDAPVGGLLRTIAALMLVLGGMILFLNWYRGVLQRGLFGPCGDDQPIKVLGSRGLGAGKSIALVEVGGELLVLGMSKEGVSLLTRISRSRGQDEGGDEGGGRE